MWMKRRDLRLFHAEMDELLWRETLQIYSTQSAKERLFVGIDKRC